MQTFEWAPLKTCVSGPPPCHRSPKPVFPTSALYWLKVRCVPRGSLGGATGSDCQLAANAIKHFFYTYILHARYTLIRDVTTRSCLSCFIYFVIIRYNFVLFTKHIGKICSQVFSGIKRCLSSIIGNIKHKILLP